MLINILFFNVTKAEVFKKVHFSFYVKTSNKVIKEHIDIEMRSLMITLKEI